MAKGGRCLICGVYSKCIYRHEIKCKKQKEFLDYYKLDKEKIQTEYNNLGSVLAFKEKYNLILNSRNDYYKLFQDIGIKYSVSQSASHKNVREKSKKKCLERYGYEHNFQKNSSSRIKWEKRLLEEEGITNVFQRDLVKKKSQESIIKKYGSLSNKSKYTVRGRSISNLNQWLYKILNNLHIEYRAEFPLKKTGGGIYYYDCLIGSNKFIEINGDYWHGNPRIYKSNDIILKGSHSEIIVKNKWISDKKKIKFAKKNGFSVLTIWEFDIKLDEQDIINRIIKYAKD